MREDRDRCRLLMWLTVLFAGPFHVIELMVGARYPAPPIWAAAGFLLALLSLCAIARAGRPLCVSPGTRRAVFGIGTRLTAIALLPELALLPKLIGVGCTWAPIAEAGLNLIRQEDVNLIVRYGQDGAMLTCGMLAAICSFSVGPAADAAGRGDAERRSRSDVDDVCLLMAFLLGLSLQFVQLALPAGFEAASALCRTAGGMLALAIALAGLSLIAEGARPRRTQASARDLSILVASLAGGVLVRALMTRFTPVSELLVDPLMLAGGGGGVALFVWRAARAIRSGRVAARETAPVIGERAQAREAGLLGLFGLSARERQIARAMLEPQATSARIAERMGISPSTVRTTMHRVYGKTGCDGLGSLRILAFAEEPAAQSPPEEDAGRASAPEWAPAGGRAGEPHRSCAPYALRACLIMLSAVFLPVGRSAQWGAGAGELTGIAIACIMFGGLAIMRTTMREEARPLSRVRLAALAGALALSSFAASHRIAFDLNRFHDFNPVSWCPAYLVCAVFSLSFLAAASLMRELVDQDRKVLGTSRRAQLIGTIAPAAAALAALASDLFVPVMAAVGCVAGGSLVFCLRQLNAAREARTRDVEDGFARSAGADTATGTETVRMLAALAWAALCLGVCYEELWRATTWFSLILAAAPLFAIIAVVELRRAAAHGPDVARLAAIRLALCLSAGAIQGSVLLGAAVFALWSLLARPDLFMRAVALVAFGAGGLAASYLGNMVTDIMDRAREWVQMNFGNGRALTVIVTMLLAMVLASGGVAWGRLCDLIEQRRLRRRWESQLEDGDAAVRTKAFFISRGLSDLQAEILLAVVDGRSNKEIARRLSYSVSSIKAMRRASYLQLGVSRTAGLFSLLAQRKTS